MLHPNNPRVDFALPGWVATPSTRYTCLSSLAYAYDRHWNPRNLEYPWYDPWSQILQGLVADLPSLAVAPQTYLWYYPHPSSGDYHIRPPSTQDGDDYYEEGNTLDSIASIHVGHRRNKYQLVDFAIIRKVSRNRSAPVHPPVARAADGRFYLTRKMGYVGIPILCELKRGAPRTSNIRVSLERSVVQLHSASEQLVRQAHHLFAMYPHQEEVLLIAAAGLWWSYRVLQRNESKFATTSEMDAAEAEENDIKPDEFEEPEGVHDGVAGVIIGPDARDQDLSDSPSIYHGLENVTFQDQISDRCALHLLMTQIDFKLSAANWSSPLLFGTPPSNQAFYLIHQHLSSIVNDGFNGTKG